MDPRDGLPAVKITCPYTTQNCPLFAPSFSLESVQPVSHLPTVRKDVEQTQKQSPEQAERQEQAQQSHQQQYTALPPIRPRAELPEARSSRETTQQTARTQQQPLPSLRLPSLDYSDYSLAPSPSPSGSTSSAPAPRRPSESYPSQPRQLPPYLPQHYPLHPLEQQRPQAGSTTSLYRGPQRGESESDLRGAAGGGGGGAGEGSVGRYENGGGRRYSLLHMGREAAPVAEEGGARAEGSPTSAMREEPEQRWGPGQWARIGEGYGGEDQRGRQPTPSGSGSASIAASPSLSGEEEAVAESSHSEMVTPFISSKLLSPGPSRLQLF